ncbi:hypothetical protein ACI79D_14700 [Geodermatophilus sp. SYSU D00708]
MTAALLTTAPFALRDVEDLAEADLDAHLAERLDEAGRVPGAPAEARTLAATIGAAALAAHALGARAHDLLG